MTRTRSLVLTFLAMMAIALPVLGVDPRCETAPDHPACEEPDEAPPPPPTTTTTMPAPAPDAFAAVAVAVVGCSNTNHAVTGYLDLSELDILVNTAYAGHTVEVWASDPLAWADHYLPPRPVDGFDGVWFNLCERAEVGLTKENAETVLAKIWEIDPGVPVWVSPLNYYQTEDCEVTAGNQIPNEGAEIADSLAAEYEAVLRGPDLGPLTSEMLRRDMCHQNGAGVVLNGQQLLEFFDQELLPGQ